MREGEPSPTLDREVLQRIEFPETMSRELAERWADGIPQYSEADPKRREWRPTRVVPLDLSREGFGTVHVKDESDRASNPTGTIKDRAAWELATLYRDYARALELKRRARKLSPTELEDLTIPRLTLLTAGNEGLAVARMFARYELPPPKLILDRTVPEARRSKLTRERADIYLADLSQRPYTGDELKALSDNPHGVDITSVRSLHPEVIFYDWHVHEVFNERPDVVYVPYGSGRLMENYLAWQERTARNAAVGARDPRLEAPAGDVLSLDVFGAEPRSEASVADKLVARYKPFLLFEDKDIADLAALSFTGRNSRREQIDDERIRFAHELLGSRGIEAEPSAAAGLALYLAHYERGLIRPDEKVVVVNTGSGIDRELETATEA